MCGIVVVPACCWLVVFLSHVDNKPLVNSSEKCKVSAKSANDHSDTDSCMCVTRSTTATISDELLPTKIKHRSTMKSSHKVAKQSCAKNRSVHVMGKEARNTLVKSKEGRVNKYSVKNTNVLEMDIFTKWKKPKEVQNKLKTPTKGLATRSLRTPRKKTLTDISTKVKTKHISKSKIYILSMCLMYPSSVVLKLLKVGVHLKYVKSL